MKTPRDKYMNDPEYRQLVLMMEGFIEKAHFSPSELREACVLASINYEMRNVRLVTIDPELDHALGVLDRKFTHHRG